MASGWPATRLTKSIPIDKDVDVQGQATQVDAGVIGWRIFVFNQQNPAAKNFKGVSYFPYDHCLSRDREHSRPIRSFRRACSAPRAARTSNSIMSASAICVAGKADHAAVLRGEQRSAKITDMSAFFTRRSDTARVRMARGAMSMSADFGKFPPATVTIDFNMAYNPNCARSAHFTCPIATDTIALAMKAGEKDPHMAH